MKDNLQLKYYARLFKEDYQLAPCMVRVHSSVMSEQNIQRHDWVVITSEAAAKPVYRQVYGTPQYCKGFIKGMVMIDYDASRLLLGEETKCTPQDEKVTKSIHEGVEVDETIYLMDQEWTMKSIKKWELFRAYWNYPDQGYKISLQIALISFCIGLMSLLLGCTGVLISIFL